jgi:hypothetical protein
MQISRIAPCLGQVLQNDEPEREKSGPSCVKLEDLLWEMEEFHPMQELQDIMDLEIYFLPKYFLVSFLYKISDGAP